MTLPSTSLEQSTLQIAYQHRQIEEYQTEVQKAAESLKEIEILGHLGVGGQKGYVYKADAVSPCLPATQYKDPTKILE